MPSKSSLKALSLGSNFVAGMGILSFIGYKLDIYYNNQYYILTLVGLFLGFFWAMYKVFKVVQEESEEDGSNL